VWDFDDDGERDCLLYFDHVSCLLRSFFSVLDAGRDVADNSIQGSKVTRL